MAIVTVDENSKKRELCSFCKFMRVASWAEARQGHIRWHCEKGERITEPNMQTCDKWRSCC